MRVPLRSFVLALAALSAGCAEQLQLLERGPTGGRSTATFWPPPPATTSVAVPAAQDDATFGDVERRIATALREAGYADARWYPIGVAFRHGFAVSTRIEAIDHDARPVLDRRWSSLHSTPPTLMWLRDAHDARLPESARCRAFLIAFTDLPEPSSNVAPRWSEETFMEGPGLPEGTSAGEVPAERPATTAYHVDVYVYEYEAGQRVGRDTVTARQHVRAAGLADIVATRD